MSTAQKKSKRLGSKTDNGRAAGLVETGLEDDLYKIQEILFGRQVRIFEERFSGLEAALNKQQTALELDLENRLGQLGTDLNSQLADLTGRLEDGLANERSDRKKDAKNLKANLEESERTLTEALEAVKAEAANTSFGLKEALENKAADIAGELEKTRLELTVAVGSSVAALDDRLSGEKLDVAELANILAAVAHRLGEESTTDG